MFIIELSHVLAENSHSCSTVPCLHPCNISVPPSLPPSQDFELDVLEEAYTTEHWIVRIYKVKDLENRGV